MSNWGTPTGRTPGLSRTLDPDPQTLVTLRMPVSLRTTIDAARGEEPRNAFILRACLALLEDQP